MTVLELVLYVVAVYASFTLGALCFWLYGKPRLGRRRVLNRGPCGDRPCPYPNCPPASPRPRPLAEVVETVCHSNDKLVDALTAHQERLVDRVLAVSTQASEQIAAEMFAEQQAARAYQPQPEREPTPAFDPGTQAFDLDTGAEVPTDSRVD